MTRRNAQAVRPAGPHAPVVSDDELEMIQRRCMAYFLHRQHPATGLFPDSTELNKPANITTCGFGLTCLGVAAERGWITHAEGLSRSLRLVRTLCGLEQSRFARASGYRGFFYRFLDMQTGRRAYRCELSTLDTAYLAAGLLAAAAYFDDDELHACVQQLISRVQWAWMLSGDKLLRHGWKPAGGFLPYRYERLDEAVLLYVLAAGAEAHAVPPTSWARYARSFVPSRQLGVAYVHFGSLFVHQYPHAWLDLNGLQDKHLQAAGLCLFENSRRATQVQQAYGVANPLQHAGYDAAHWGVSAGDGPVAAGTSAGGAGGRRGKAGFGYAGRCILDVTDDGTLSPWAAAASLPFAPELCLPLIRRVLDAGPPPAPHAFAAATNPSAGWQSTVAFGFNEAMLLLAIENYRGGGVWRRMRGCSQVRRGLAACGFAGGWLGELEAAA
ncbi:MAG: glucoamylase family protein [Phycisphaerae bacterium]